MQRIESCSIICKLISLADYKQAVDQKEHKKNLILEGLDVLEMFLDSLMTWLYLMILVTLTEDFRRFIPLNVS